MNIFKVKLENHTIHWVKLQAFKHICFHSTLELLRTYTYMLCESSLISQLRALPGLVYDIPVPSFVMYASEQRP